MTDTELADALVAMAIGWKSQEQSEQSNPYRIPYAPMRNHHVAAAQFVRDWRVAGAVIEILLRSGHSFLLARMPDDEVLMTITAPMPNRKQWDSQVCDADACRAIAEAGAKVLS